MGFEDEVEQSNGRPCRQSNDRAKRTCELTSSIAPRGTSFHRWVDLEFPPIAFDSARTSCRCAVPGPAATAVTEVSFRSYALEILAEHKTLRAAMVGQQARNPILRIIFNQCIYKVVAVLRDDITHQLRTREAFI